MKKFYRKARELINSKFAKSFSQEGEDIILERMFGSKSDGFFVDVGSHHPIRFSNTYAFYKKGWRGINIDGAPGSKYMFDKYRPRDLNFEYLISNEEKKHTFYIFNEQALNTLDPEVAQQKAKIPGYHIEKEVELESKKLVTILDEFVKDNLHIDFMSIDVEGVDFEVVKSNDWIKYSPDVVLVESIGSDIENISKEPIVEYLKKYDYKVFSKLYNTVILHHDRFKPN